MLIPLRSIGQPKFHINEVRLGYFFVVFSFALFTEETFERSDGNMLYVPMLPGGRDMWHA
jgi:hypothetical protein